MSVACNWCVSLGSALILALLVSLSSKTVETGTIPHTENVIRCIHLENHNVEVGLYLSGS